MNKAHETLLAVAIMLALFGAGYLLGADSVKSDCDNFGKFKYGAVFYECKRMEVTK